MFKYTDFRINTSYLAKIRTVVEINDVAISKSLSLLEKSKCGPLIVRKMIRQK